MLHKHDHKEKRELPRYFYSDAGVSDTVLNCTIADVSIDGWVKCMDKAIELGAVPWEPWMAGYGDRHYEERNIWGILTAEAVRSSITKEMPQFTKDETQILINVLRLGEYGLTAPYSGYDKYLETDKVKVVVAKLLYQLRHILKGIEEPAEIGN